MLNYKISAVANDFPYLIIAKLKDFEVYQDSLQTISITFTTKIYFDDENVDYFFDYISRYFPKTKIELDHIQHIEKTSAISLIQNENCINHLDDQTLIDLIPLSEKSVQFCLQNNLIAKRINNVNKKPHEQTFSASCTAVSIMQYLLDHHKISQQEFTRCKELEIYSKIWRSPGEKADLRKIIEFCYKNDIKLIGIDIKDRSSKFLSADKSLQMKYLYKFFKQVFVNNYVEINSADLDINSVNISSKTLLIFANQTMDTHVVYAFKSKENCISVIDSANENGITHYASWKDLITDKKEFTGVGLGLSSLNMTN
ncbi:MAG: hypothetical protein ACD_46C00184G0012 [uncultured bacterium]|nr:MAG: hypothetical protein ACD_46C00184G0012 [uncultured bacterium]